MIANVETYPSRGSILGSHLDRRLVLFLASALFGSLVHTLAAKTNVPIGPVNLSLQTLAVFLLAAAFGLRLGLATILLYLAQGAAGLPVFQASPASGIGLAYMAGPTGGYLAGFVVATALIGWAADRGLDRSVPRFVVVLMLAELCIMALGYSWLSLLVGAGRAWQFGVAPFIVPDLVKLAIVALLVPAVWIALRRVPPRKRPTR